VDLEIVEYVPGRRGLGPVEWTAIYIGARVAESLVSSITEDAYERAKEMLRSRRRAKRAKGTPGAHLGFTIYRPNGEELSK